MKLVCPDCGPVESALVDGYYFGDRLLEDVFFKITVESSKLKSELSDEYDNYMKGLNKVKWLKEAVRHAQNDDNMLCPLCDECGVYLDNES